MEENMNILVTGGAGFIGSNLVDALIEAGHQVTVVDNVSTGKREYVNRRADFQQMDIQDARLAEVFATSRPEVVFHLAAQINVQTSLQEPGLDADINILGSIRVLELCRRYGVRKIIYPSSAAVYGDPLYLGIKEDHPIKPLSFYGISKYTAEPYIQVYAALYGLDYTILRYANVYGMRQDPQGEGGVISIFLNKMVNGEPPVIYGNGEQTRDFIYIKDVVSANLAAIDRGSRAVLNISTNHSTRIQELAALMSRILGYSGTAIYQEGRPGDIEHSRLAHAEAVKHLNWHPAYSLLQGLTETCEFYKKKLGESIA
jgi:UDP-glucose 4-epimerase